MEVTTAGRAKHRRLAAANDAIMAEQLVDWSAAELQLLVGQLERLVVDLRSTSARPDAEAR